MHLAAQAAIASKAESCNTKSCDKKSFVDDDTKEKLKDAADKAQAIAKDLAETSVEVAKAGLAGLKAGIEEAKKAYNENKKN